MYYQEFLPQNPEPTIYRGSPPPMRRRSTPFSVKAHDRHWLADEKVDPMYSMPLRATFVPPSKVVSDNLLSKAFGANPILFQSAPTTSVIEDEETSELEALKKLSVREILDVMRGEDPCPPRSSPILMARPHMRGDTIYPPLPIGPPPPTCTPSPLRDRSVWNETSTMAVSAIHNPQKEHSCSHC